jgi:YebC/PmpR family DNA-binding regulatory protein
MNARLAVAVEAARKQSVPNDTIARAIKKGSGQGADRLELELVPFEGFAPHKVPVIVECLTDNRNRTAGDVRFTFEKGGGNLAAPGAVAWSFERRGVVEVKAGPTEEGVVEAAIEAGAEDVVGLGADGFEVRTHPNDLHAVVEALRRTLPVGGSRITQVPRETLHVADPEKARALLRLVDLLEELDDVQRVHGNFEIDERLLQELSS